MSNDVYNVDVKFSLVVQPSADNDDLIVKVVDDKGNVVKTARIAGEQKEDEDFEYAKTETDENGVPTAFKAMYIINGKLVNEVSTLHKDATEIKKIIPMVADLRDAFTQISQMTKEEIEAQAAQNSAN